MDGKNPVCFYGVAYVPVWFGSRWVRVFEFSFHWHGGPAVRFGMAFLRDYFPFEGGFYRPTI